MVWDVSQDDFNDRCGEGKFPLLNTIANGMLSYLSNEEKPAAPTSPAETTKPEAESNEDNKGNYFISFLLLFCQYNLQVMKVKVFSDTLL